MVEDEAAAGQGASPFLRLDGFTGPLDHLLTLARAQKIDLAALSLTALVDQLTASLQQAPALSLGQKGNWVVMAAWLVQLRTRLLLPADAPEQREAAADAAQLRDRLTTLQAMRGLVGWLERRSQLGHDVLARGQPEVFGVSADAGPVVDIIAFLWASLALFDDNAAVLEMTPLYRPLHLDLYAVIEAQGRILQQLADVPEGLSLDRLLPEVLDDTGRDSRQILRRRSAWSSTFVASLELAKQGNVVLEQVAFLDPVHVRAVSTGASGGVSDQPGCPC
jgi:segregation and condensation protein A